MYGPEARQGAAAEQPLKGPHMLRRSGISVVLTSGLLLAAAGPADAANCGRFSSTNHYGGNGIFVAKASGISCAKAKKVLARFFWEGGTADDPVSIPKWSCRQLSYYNPGRAAYRCRSRAGAVTTAYWTGEG
jgi:hypothetical protein